MASKVPEREGLIRGFLGRLRFPQLFALLAGLFLLDFFVMDPIPMVDEAILAILAVMFGMWKDHRPEKQPPPRNVTPGADKPTAPSER